MKNREYTFRPIGIVHSPFKEKAGTPIQSSFAGEATGQIEVLEEYAEGLCDCEGFSHLVVLYVFDRSEGYDLKLVPFRDTEQRGVFACRAPRRPNPIGLTIVRLIEVRGNVLEIAELDMLDGTPVLDIKPYVPMFDERTDARMGWLEGSRDRRTADDRF